MQSKTTRGLRRLLVSTGVISLVLSVAAPAVLAAQPELAGTPGAQMVKVCHKGKVLEMEQAALQAHLGHGDVLADEGAQRGDACAAPGAPVEGDVTPEPVTPEPVLVRVCFKSAVDELAEDQLEEWADDIDATATGLEDLELGASCGAAVVDETPQEHTGGATFVEVCHHGEVLEIEEHALDGHLGHGDVLISDDVVCGDGPGDNPPAALPDPIISALTITRPMPPAPVVPTAPAVTNVPTPAVPASPVAAPATPVVAPVTSSTTDEVLGSVTTRTPSGATITALAATGSSTTTVLAALGTVLLLAGLGLQVTARRRVRSSDVGA